jgi:hypothetical protein
VVFGVGNVRGHGWRILRLDEATGRTSVLAGCTSDADTIYADGPVMQARFRTIRDLCYAPGGTLFVNDANPVIRKITPNGEVTTWAF